jgi:hypothetical protein
VSDGNDIDGLSEFMNSLLAALEHPESDPELLELIEDSLGDSTAFERASELARGESPVAAKDPRSHSHRQDPRPPANLGEHLLAAVGKAEDMHDGVTDRSSPLVSGRNGIPPRVAGGNRHPASRAGQSVAAKLIQTIARVA